MAEIYATVTQSLTEDFNNPSSPLDTPPFLSIPEQAEHLDTAIDNFYTAYIQYLDDRLYYLSFSKSSNFWKASFNTV